MSSCKLFHTAAGNNHDDQSKSMPRHCNTSSASRRTLLNYTSQTELLRRLQAKERGCLFGHCALCGWTLVHRQVPPWWGKWVGWLRTFCRLVSHPKKTCLLKRPQAAVCSSDRLRPPVFTTFARLSPLIRLFEVALDTLPFPALVIRRSNSQLPKRTHASRLFPPRGLKPHPAPGRLAPRGGEGKDDDARKAFSVTVEECERCCRRHCRLHLLLLLLR